MDNLKIQTVMIDGNLVELRIDAISEYVSIHQSCYVSDSDLSLFSKRIADYISDPKSECYLEFGKKSGNYTPAFSMLILPMNRNGHVMIEVDFEIDDNPDRKHRCSFYINSELGCIEGFGRRLAGLLVNEIGTELELNPEV
ncbi:hypothetical protein SAMN06296952_0465 [Oscillospiraceae bacterium]|nr:hypothetical protein SAMN06296952_0465 [Oscillospiraceae bacterium]